MEFNKEEILKEVLQNERVAERVTELKLSKKQMNDALSILIDMANENDDSKVKTLTSFYIDKKGIPKRMVVLSTKGKQLEYLNNILTQEINFIDFENIPEFYKEESRKEVVAAFSKFIKSDSTPKKGIYIYGDMGIGKTFMFKIFAKKIAQKGKKVGFINLSALISKIKSTFGTTESSELILEDLTKIDYLFIDDIGSEKISSWFRDDFLFTLLNERMDKKRITFFTSNYSQNALLLKESKTSGSKYRDSIEANRLISRIKTLSIEINVKGTNKRY